MLRSIHSASNNNLTKYCILSDIGKIILYHDTIIKRDKTTNSILLKSGFKIEDRLKWNPSWKKPDTVELDKNGFMQVWYLDGEEENLNLRAEEKATYSTIQ